MNLNQVSQLRRIAGKVATYGCLIFFLAALDGIISQTRQPLDFFEVLPGATEKFNVTLKEKVEGIEELSYKSSSSYIHASFESIQKGFWLGGLMCHGVIMVSPDIQPGEYSLSIGHKNTISQKPFSVFRIMVYQDFTSYRQNSKTLIFRYLGFSPWWIVVFFPFLIVSAIGSVFLLSKKREYLLAQSGKAEIYHIKVVGTAYHIAFGLGNIHGMQPGIQLILCDQLENPIGNAEVIEVYQTDSLATVDINTPIKLGNLVSKA